MKYETIEFKKEKNVTTIYLNRPDVHNAMNDKLINELTNFFKDLYNDDKTRIIILSGNGKSFCAGADLHWMKSMINYSLEENINDSSLLLNLFETIYNCPKPVIGRINGSAFGGGLGLLAVCDIVVAVSDCKFAFTEIRLGIIPAVVSTYIIKRIGVSNAKRLFITGEKFDANYAKEIGLVDHVASQNEIDNVIKQYIELLFYSAPKAIAEVKKLINAYEKFDLEKYKEFT
ncbi:MAG: enoyl-CoA hydratase-related protein, partial [Candidatus Thermoplasmatota archaeon]|nr:enoyl-CoA hydratase-related protein [Candidatus Thermoplasmatota archaeon]